MAGSSVVYKFRVLMHSRATSSSTLTPPHGGPKWLQIPRVLTFPLTHQFVLLFMDFFLLNQRLYFFFLNEILKWLGGDSGAAVCPGSLWVYLQIYMTILFQCLCH